MNILSSFFSNLSSRFGKENDLSDITWVMCQTSPCFKAIWINFFFEKLNADEVEISREVPDSNDAGSRVDFLLTVHNDPRPYLIEVKIWDQNHHFEQYMNAYSVEKERLGYITNYSYPKKDYNVKQWREFYELLIKKKDSFPEEEAEIITGYCEYIMNVCGIITIMETIDITKMNSLFDLTIILREISEFSNEEFNFCVKNYSTTLRDDLRWLFLEVDYNQVNGWGKQYPFIGIIHRHATPPKKVICAGFDGRKGWARNIVDYMVNNFNMISSIKLDYCIPPQRPERKSGDFYFFMSDNAFKKFRDASEIEQQKKVLKGFVNEVLSLPLRLYNLIISRKNEVFSKP